ncbi:MAG: hypothetical protein JWO77_2129 [Ilumatobacteraceae bacterium]|nr:hypothetical protein [Ilumatobacteraceae bacterium]
MAETRKSELEDRQDQAGARDALPAIVALIVSHGIVASLDLDADTDRWQLMVLLLPLLAGVWLGWAQLRTLRRSDEYQRTVHLEAMSVGFAVAMFVAMGGGLLSGADVGSDAQYLQVTFIAGILSWVATLTIRMRR